MPLQQSAPVVQIWPYCEQTGGGGVASGGGVEPSDVVEPSSPVALSLVPASGGGGVPPSEGGTTVPHVPTVLPCGTMHELPGQQSAVTVQLPDVGTQILPPSGTMRQRSCPVLSGTQGTPLQQSPVYAHVWPGARQAPIAWQRGTPSASSWQASELPGAPQQLSGALDTLHE
jgi:hypothetical protein